MVKIHLFKVEVWNSQLISPELVFCWCFCVDLQSLSLLAAGSESRTQSLYKAVNVAEGVVERHWSDSQHAGFPHVTSDPPLLQLLEDFSDVDGEGERELTASLPRVRGRQDADVRFVRLGGVLSVVMSDQVLQVTSQQEGLPAQRLHAGHVKHLQTGLQGADQQDGLV